MSRVPTKIGKYQIDGKIAEGGMGAVFKGTHPTLEKPVVLKKLTFSNNDHLIERFRREAKIMMEFSNENIVRVYDHFKQASAYYIVQELVDGKSVDIILKKERYLKYDEALYVFYYACKALDYAHKNQVVHRDIKPANILVSKTGEIKLVDFGIAQSDDEEDALTKEGMALGTPSYMAPEQYDDSRNVTFKADIYSLGVMLYEMVTGKKPYPGKMTPETLLKIQKGKYTAVRKANPALPRSVNWFIRKSVQSNPKKRADSVALILKKLEKWYRATDIDGVRENLILLVNDKERRPDSGKSKRSVKMGFLIPIAAAAVLAAAGFFLYAKGFHYRTLYAGSYGGFYLRQEIKSPELSWREYSLEIGIFPDVEGRIGDETVDSFRIRASRPDEEGAVVLESSKIYLPPGAYWLKSTVGNRVFWQNILVKPLTPDRFSLKPLEPELLMLNWPATKSKELTVSVDVRSRSDGRDLNPVAEVAVEVGSSYVPLDALEEPLVTGKAYNFRVSAEGYYPLVYDLGIRRHQDQLTLESRLIPREGHLRLSSTVPLVEDEMEILINGDSSILAGGLATQMLETELLKNQKPLPLVPGTYQLSFIRGRLNRKVETETEITITSGEETVLVVEFKKENERTSEILVEERL
ncbi:MAG: serine/threonine-protein kinase [Spirochaetales bacterium]|nr:serine/threonine-protein kinase [Spirochaetales bacterium]